MNSIRQLRSFSQDGFVWALPLGAPGSVSLLRWQVPCLSPISLGMSAGVCLTSTVADTRSCWLVCEYPQSTPGDPPIGHPSMRTLGTEVVRGRWRRSPFGGSLLEAFAGDRVAVLICCTVLACRRCCSGANFTSDPLLRRCRTVVRCSLLPAEIARKRLIAGHGIQSCWCRLWVSARPTDLLDANSSHETSLTIAGAGHRSMGGPNGRMQAPWLLHGLLHMPLPSFRFSGPAYAKLPPITGVYCAVADRCC